MNEGLSAYVTAKFTGVPFCCYVHGEDVNVAKTSRDLSFATRVVLRNAQMLIANSSFTKDSLVDDWGVADERVILINPGVDASRFRPFEGTSSLEEKDSLHLMTAGRLQKRKGHDIVIQAIPDLLKTFPKFK